MSGATETKAEGQSLSSPSESGISDALKVASWLSIFFGIVSFFLLIQKGAQFGLAAPLKMLVGYYDGAIQYFGDWIKPLVEGVVSLLNSSLGWNVRLRPDWKYSMLAVLAFYSAIYRGSISPSAVGLGVVMIPVMAAAMLVPGGLHTPTPAGFGYGLTLLVFLLMVLGGLARLGFKSNAVDRAGVWRFMSVPLGVIFLLLTNAGLRLIPGM